MFLEIALDTPLRRVFDYRCPPNVAAAGLKRGIRICVPFGRRRLVGILMSVKSASQIPAGKLKAALEVLDDEPVFDPALLELLTWSADYYRHPIGEVLAAALPMPLRAGAPLTEVRTQWRMTAQGETEWETLPKRSTKLRKLAAALAKGGAKGGAKGETQDGARKATADELAQISPTWRAGIRELEKRGWVVQEAQAVEPPPPGFICTSAYTLTDAQQAALAEIRRSQDRFRTLLLYGVTGSGKTEVYLRAIEEVVACGKQALVLVPEIALTPQLVERFQARFNTTLAVLHSSLNDSERLSAWRAARSGAAPIVIGTRSAVFAPLKSLGIIVVDEEHDASYKQQEGFRYSARDLSIVRAQRHGIPVVLGSATPSLESLSRARRQPGDLISLPQRAGAATAPHVRLVDLRSQAQTDGLAANTLLAIKQHLDRDGQVLLYLNRRGFAPVLFCPACGWSAACNHCDARMTVHRRAQRLKCHHCGQESEIPKACPSCASLTKPVGEGTERVEETIGKLFPGVPLARLDRDAIRRKGELETLLKHIHEGGVRILVGTQMLAKGHHFPNVTLVVILNADQGLFGADFRAAERLAQTIVQVSGRAGRAERRGEVLIQTEYPEHPLLTGLLQGGYSTFAEKALLERELAHWPPFTRLALLRAEGASMSEAMTFLNAAAEAAMKLKSPSVRLWGPVAAPMQRKAGRYRAQVLLQAASHAPLQKLLARWLPELEASVEAKKIRWSIDIDPLELF